MDNRLSEEESARRARIGFLVTVIAFIIFTGLFIFGLIMDNEDYYHIIGTSFYLMPVIITIAILYHKGIIIKPKQDKNWRS